MANWVADYLERHPDQAALPIRRDRYGLHVRQPNGTFRAQFTGAPMHYQDAGEWKPIDTALVRKAATTWGAPGVPVTIDDDGVVSIDGSTYSQRTTRAGLYRPSTQAFSSILTIPRGTLSGDEFIASGPAWERHLRLTEQGLREELILLSQPTNTGAQAGDYLVLETQLLGLDLPDGILAEFQAGGMRFPLPFARDGNRRRIPCVRRIRKVGGVYYLYTGIPVSALVSAVYPITIDPDFTTRVTNYTVGGYHATYLTARSTSAYYTADYMWVGAWLDGGNHDLVRAAIEFDTISIPDGATATAVTMTLTCLEDYSDTDFDLVINQADWVGYSPIDASNQEAVYDAILAAPAETNIWRNTNGMSINTQYTSGALDPTWIWNMGRTAYGLISSRDISATENTGSEGIEIGGTTEATPAYRPFLTVTWSPTRKFWWTDTKADGVEHLLASETMPDWPSEAKTTGWIVGTATSTKYALMDSNTERTAASFNSTAVPGTGGPNNTLGSSFRSANKITGTFAAGTWSLNADVSAVTAGGDQDGAITWRLWRSANADGSGATQITSAIQTTSTLTNINTSAVHTYSDVSLSAVTLTNEYLFIDLGWKITGAGGGSTWDVYIHQGYYTALTTPVFNFTATVAGALATAGVLGKSAGKKVAGALATAGVVGKSAGKKVAGVLATAGTIAKSATRPKALAGVLATAGVIVKSVRKPLAGPLVSTGTIARVATYRRAVAGTLVSAGVLVKSIPRTLAGALVSTGVIGKVATYRRAVAGALVAGGTFTKSVTKGLVGVLNSTGAIAIVTTYRRAVAGALDTTGVLAKAINKGLAGELDAFGSLIKEIGKGLAGALDTSGILVKSISNVLAGELVSDGVISKVINQALAGVLDTSGGLVKAIGKGLSGTLDTSGELVKAITKSIDGALESSGVLIKSIAKGFAGALDTAGELATEVKQGIVAIYIDLAGALVTSGEIAKGISKGLTGVLAADGTLTKYATKGLAGVLDTSGVLIKAIDKGLDGALLSTGTLAKSIGKGIAGVFDASGVIAIGRAYLKTLTGVLDTSGVLAKSIGKGIAGDLVSNGGIGKALSKGLAGILDTTGVIAKSIEKPLAGVLVSGGGLVKSTGKVLAGTLVSAGTLVKSADKRLAGVLASNGSLLKAVGKPLAGVLDSSGVAIMTRRYFVALAGVLVSSGVVGAVVTLANAIVGHIGLLGSRILRGSLTGSYIPSAALAGSKTGVTLTGSHIPGITLTGSTPGDTDLEGSV
jgi:hypothetical protein